MAIYGYTKNYKLIKPKYDSDTWHDYEYDNLDTIDAVMSAIYSSGQWKGFWANNTQYDVNDVVIDRDMNVMYRVLVQHITDSDSTFIEYQEAYPQYYELWSPNNLAKDWAVKMDDKISVIDYSSKAYAISEGLIPEGSALEHAKIAVQKALEAELSASAASVSAELAQNHMQSAADEAASAQASAVMAGDSESLAASHEVNANASATNAATSAALAQQAANTAVDAKEELLNEVQKHIGAGIVLGFNGTLVDGRLVFTPDADVEYEVRPNYDYEIDLHYPDVEELPDETQFFLRLSTDGEEIPLRNVKSVSSPATYKQMTQVSDIINGIGTRWIFMSRYKENVNDKCFGIIATVVKADAEGASPRNVGEIVTSSIPLTDAGLILADGSLLSASGVYKDGITKIVAMQATNPELFCTEDEFQASVDAYGACGKYVYDSDAGTLRIPKLQGFLEGTNNPLQIGDLTPAGLPNIIGEFAAGSWNGTSGAFADSVSSASGSTTTSGGVFDFSRIDFDASRSSSVYGNSDTVQPQSIKVYYYVCLANSVQTADKAVTEQLTHDLALKADLDMSNVTEQGKEKAIAWSSPDYTATISFTLSQSTPFTAPSAGVVFQTATSVTRGYINGVHVMGSGTSVSENGVCAFAVIGKGDVLTTANSSVTTYFAPMKGAV